MATQNDFARRRRERQRRERARKKRRRAILLLILFVALIVAVIIVINACKNGENQQNGSVTLTQSGEQINDQSSGGSVTLTSADAVPTAVPAHASLNIPPASEENDLMQIIRDSSESKYCYLTFDDGPTDNITPQILDTLRRYNVKATFFQIGSLIKANPTLARRVYDEGHLLANHSDGHNYAKLYVSTDTFMNEVNDCYEAIKDVTGEAEPFKLVRFPGGSFRSSADSYSPVKQECKEVMAQYGFYQCDWNALNGDAEGAAKDADELLDYMISNLDGEDNVVVLMHDAASKQATADALPMIIEYFINKGYTFHRLDDIVYNAPAAATAEGSDDGESSETTKTASGSGSSETSSTPAPTPASTPSNNSTNPNAIIIQ